MQKTNKSRALWAMWRDIAWDVLGHANFALTPFVFFPAMWGLASVILSPDKTLATFAAGFGYLNHIAVQAVTHASPLLTYPLIALLVLSSVLSVKRHISVCRRALSSSQEPTAC